MVTLNSLTTMTPLPGECPIYVTGKALRKMLHGSTAAVRVEIATRFAREQWILVEPLQGQAAALCRADTAKVGAALGHAGSRTIDKIVKRFGTEPLTRGLHRAATNGNGAAI